jgi:hypothetical protein
VNLGGLLLLFAVWLGWLHWRAWRAERESLGTISIAYYRRTTRLMATNSLYVRGALCSP